MGYNFSSSNPGMDGEFLGTYGLASSQIPSSYPVYPMERVRVAVDDYAHSILVVLEREGIAPSPAVALSVGQAVTLIQALRMGINDIEMLPPLPFSPSLP